MTQTLKLMKRLLRGTVLALLIGCVGLLPAEAQPIDEENYEAEGLTSQRRPLRVTARPLYQYYEDDGAAISEWSLPIQATIPLLESLQLNLRGSVASVSGDNVEDLSGLGDVQASLSYAQEVGDGSLILSLGANLPTGKRELTVGEFQTATVLSQNYYAFQVPTFGQGFNIATGATWAIPVSDNVTVGLGGSYQRRGGYAPIEGMAEDYNPGDEFIVTGGLDYGVTQTSALSADVSFTAYGTDTVGDTDQFEAGNKIAGRLQYLYQSGFNSVRVLARYESRDKSTIPATAAAQELQVLPSQGAFRLSYDRRIGSFTLGLWGDGRLFGETEAYDSQTLFRLGVAPAFSAGSNVVLMPRAAATFGDLTGVQAGLTLQVQQ